MAIACDARAAGTGLVIACALLAGAACRCSRAGAVPVSAARLTAHDGSPLLDRDAAVFARHSVSARAYTAESSPTPTTFSPRAGLRLQRLTVESIPESSRVFPTEHVSARQNEPRKPASPYESGRCQMCLAYKSEGRPCHSNLSRSSPWTSILPV
jgi:hypothetical protein